MTERDEAWRKDPERVVIHNGHKANDDFTACVRCGVTLEELKKRFPYGVVCLAPQRLA